MAVSVEKCAAVRFLVAEADLADRALAGVAQIERLGPLVVAGIPPRDA